MKRTLLPKDEKLPIREALAQAVSWKTIAPDDECRDIGYYYDDLKTSPLWELSVYTEAELAEVDTCLPLLFKEMAEASDDGWFDNNKIQANLAYWSSDTIVFPASAFYQNTLSNRTDHHVKELVEFACDDGLSAKVKYKRFTGIRSLPDGTKTCSLLVSCTREVDKVYLDSAFPGWHDRYLQYQVLGGDSPEALRNILRPLPAAKPEDVSAVIFESMST